MLDIIPHQDRIPFVCLGRCTLTVKGFSIVVIDLDGKFEIPIERYSALLLEPGCNITHEAIKLCSELNVFVFWVGESGVRLYSTGGSVSKLTSKRLLKQALIIHDQDKRYEAARRLYIIMFPNDEIPLFSTIDQLRGHEGAKVRLLYKEIASSFSLEWTSKDEAPSNLQKSINMANSCLYGLCEIAIIICGYSPALGVVHSGNPKSLVYDLSDTVKFNEITPIAFQAYLDCPFDENILSYVRREIRDHAKDNKLIVRLIQNVKKIMGE